MNTIKPYKKINEALAALDNGGRFYNLFTKADDGIITAAEIGKTGGVFNNKQQNILFLETSLLKLNSNDKNAILSKLDEKLKEDYLKFKPQCLLPSEVNEKGKIASGLIVSGVPKLIESKTHFNGFIMIPIMVGKIMTFTMLPMYERYDVYELRDETTSKSFIIAHSKSDQKLQEEKITLAGIIKELKTSKSENCKTKKFLEVTYKTID
jgi:hypothetical protein